MVFNFFKVLMSVLITLELSCCSVYARVEDLHEDSLYFLLRAGLLGRVEHGKKLNSKHAAQNTEQRWRADT